MAAAQAGSSPATAINAVLAVVLTAGFVSNTAYCVYLGAYGTVVGWPMLMANITIIASLLDAAYGNWSKTPLRVMALGVAVLIGAVGVMSFGMYRPQHPA